MKHVTADYTPEQLKERNQKLDSIRSDMSSYESDVQGGMMTEWAENCWLVLDELDRVQAQKYPTAQETNILISRLEKALVDFRRADAHEGIDDVNRTKYHLEFMRGLLAKVLTGSMTQFDVLEKNYMDAITKEARDVR